MFNPRAMGGLVGGSLAGLSLRGLDVLHQATCLNKVTRDGIEHAVDVTATLRGRVEFGNLYVFVNADTDGHIGQGHHLCDGYLHQDNVHIGQAREVPVA